MHLDRRMSALREIFKCAQSPVLIANSGWLQHGYIHPLFHVCASPKLRFRSRLY